MPNDSIVVDDRPRMLVTPLRLGMRPVLLTRKPPREFHFSKIGRIEGLPYLVSRSGTESSPSARFALPEV